MEFDEVERVYRVDPLVCPKCGSEMEIIVIILDPKETTKILRHLVKNWKGSTQLQTRKLELIFSLVSGAIRRKCISRDYGKHDVRENFTQFRGFKQYL